ncbi:hypothetical protein [Myxosarcina sp. GI1]|uniref:hypothetical protein n=1 Tax=Myxosarcina sp. GI1 TaxID=1541065 RepID=UPI0005688943|nr:hypothetical protein [Myxosarcina sp. GI1]
MFKLFASAYKALNRKRNQLYLRDRCQYLYTDDCGNSVYLAPFEDWIVHVICFDLDTYLVSHFEKNTDKIFWEDFIEDSTEFIGLFI